MSLEQQLREIQCNNVLLQKPFLAEDILFILAFLAYHPVPTDLLSSYYVLSKPTLLLHEPMMVERVIDELIHAELITMESPSMLLLLPAHAETLRACYYKQIQGLPPTCQIESSTQFFLSLMTVLLNKLKDYVEYDLPEMSMRTAMYCHVHCAAQFARQDPYHDRNDAKILKTMSETANLLSKRDLSPE